MTALYLAGVVFCRPWEPLPLEPWEGPFADPHQRRPQHPEVTARRSGGGDSDSAKPEQLEESALQAWTVGAAP